MGRCKIEIKRIENATSRHVTFCKRRVGLAKKARELSILCDADVALIISSSSGQLYHFACPRRLEDIVQLYMSRHRRPRSPGPDELLPQTASLQLPSVVSPHPEVMMLRNEVERLQQGQRLRTGDKQALQKLSYEDLQKLEEEVEKGLRSIHQIKEELLSATVESMVQKQRELMKENARLLTKLMESRPYKHVLHLEEEEEEEDNYNGMMGAFSDPREEAVEKMRMSFTFSSYHHPVVILPRGEGNGEVNSPTGEGCDDASSACNDEQLLQLRLSSSSASVIIDGNGGELQSTSN